MPRRSESSPPARATGSGGGRDPPRAACEPACTAPITESSAPCAAASRPPPLSTATSASPSRTICRAVASSATGRALIATSNAFSCAWASAATRCPPGPPATTVPFVGPPNPRAFGSTRIPASTAIVTAVEIHSERSRTRSTISRRATSPTAVRVAITRSPPGRDRRASAPRGRSGARGRRGGGGGGGGRAPAGRGAGVEERLLVGAVGELDDDGAVVRPDDRRAGDAGEPRAARRVGGGALDNGPPAPAPGEPRAARRVGGAPLDIDPPAPAAALRAQRRHRPGRHDPPAAHDRDGVAQALDELELVAGEHDRHAGPRALAQHLAQHVDADRVEAGERLVEHEQLGVVRERRAELRALLVAERERLRAPLGDLGEAEALEPAPRRRPRRRVVEAVQAREVHELVGDAHLRIQAALLGHVAEPGARRGVDRPAAEAHLAGVRREDAEHDAHGGGLARAVGADEAEELPLAHGEAEAVERDRLAVAPAQAVELERGAGGPAQAPSPTQYSTAPEMSPSCRS